MCKKHNMLLTLLRRALITPLFFLYYIMQNGMLSRGFLKFACIFCAFFKDFPFLRKALKSFSRGQQDALDNSEFTQYTKGVSRYCDRKKGG